MNGAADPAVMVETRRALLDALSGSARVIHVSGRITNLPPISLAPGQAIHGTDGEAMLVFDEDGIGLSADNGLERLAIVAPSHCRAIRLSSHDGDRGTLTLERLICNGQVQLRFGDETSAADVAIRKVSIAGADASAQQERPHANGVDVLQGAMTIWNRSSQPTTVRVMMDDVEIGSPDHRVIGTGLFIAGNGDGRSGRIEIDELKVGAVYADSGLPLGTTDTVAGGVFILQDASVDTISGAGSVITYGPNAVPIDNWGAVRLWRLEGNAISHGPSAIGFINAGTLDRLEVAGVIETFGDGARGCGIYGPTGSVSARTIRTHGDAAIGVQIINTLGRLEVSDEIATQGAPGSGLVKGVMVETPAHAVHIEHGGALGELAAHRISASGRGARQLCNEGQLG